jgi:hypothetical protein
MEKKFAWLTPGMIFTIISGVASIVGLFIGYFKNEHQALIAISAFCLFLILILYKVFSTINKFVLQKTQDGSHRFASYIRYHTVDGDHIEYETHKYLQCKSLIMHTFTQNFKWTGTSFPKNITSEQQDVINIVRAEDKSNYDSVILKFREPLIYNEFTVIHVKMEMDDSDHVSRRLCSYKIEQPTQLLDFRVELKHLEENKDAEIKIRPFEKNKVAVDWEVIGWVKFDPKSRSYTKSIFNPKVGYHYVLDWS